MFIFNDYNTTYEHRQSLIELFTVPLYNLYMFEGGV